MAYANKKYVGARLSRFEEKLLMEMSKRERLTTAQMMRECIIREACRPLFGQPPISEVMVDVQD